MGEGVFGMQVLPAFTCDFSPRCKKEPLPQIAGENVPLVSAVPYIFPGFLFFLYE